jgi:hypothetical protein
LHLCDSNSHIQGVGQRVAVLPVKKTISLSEKKKARALSLCQASPEASVHLSYKPVNQHSFLL